MIIYNKYTQRLLKEWLEHGKIIVSIDYDSTLNYYHTIENQEDIDRVIELLKLVQRYTYNVVFTACNSDRFEDIKKYCESVGVRVDSINENPIPLPYGQHKKIYYNINLCDRSGLNEALYTLESAYYQYIGYKQEHKPLTEIG